jgi:hypothetical protein
MPTISEGIKCFFPIKNEKFEELGGQNLSSLRRRIFVEKSETSATSSLGKTFSPLRSM